MMVVTTKFCYGVVMTTTVFKLCCYGVVMMIDTADVMVIGTTKLCGGVMMTTTLRCYVLGYGGDYYSFLSYDVMMIDTADMLWGVMVL